MTKWLQGPPPWENTHLYHLVNSYHLQAAEKFRYMSKKDRHIAAIEKLSQLSHEDNFTDLNEDLDPVLLKGLKSIKEDQFQFKTYPMYDKYMESNLLFSQFDMAMVQVAFFASIVIFPQ